jgi:hypothetical protein
MAAAATGAMINGLADALVGAAIADPNATAAVKPVIALVITLLLSLAGGIGMSGAKPEIGAVGVTGRTFLIQGAQAFRQLQGRINFFKERRRSRKFYHIWEHSPHFPSQAR